MQQSVWRQVRSGSPLSPEVGRRLALCWVAPHGLTDVGVGVCVGGGMEQLCGCYGFGMLVTLGVWVCGYRGGHLWLTALLSGCHFAGDFAWVGVGWWARFWMSLVCLGLLYVYSWQRYVRAEQVVLLYLGLYHVPLHYWRVSSVARDGCEWWWSVLTASVVTLSSLFVAFPVAGGGWHTVLTAFACGVVNGHILMHV